MATGVTKIATPLPPAGKPQGIVVGKAVVKPALTPPSQGMKPYAFGDTFRVVDVRFATQNEMVWQEYGLLTLRVELNREPKYDGLLLKNMIVNLSGVIEGKQVDDLGLVMARIRYGAGNGVNRVCFVSSQKGLTQLMSTRGWETQCDLTIKAGENSDFPLADAGGQLLDGDGDGNPGGVCHKLFRERSDKLWKPGVTIQGH